tara:strand:+ start:92 stop:199 length:108 start_codon:yes stop_codon:yes gene_type:complete
LAVTVDYAIGEVFLFEVRELKPMPELEKVEKEQWD